MPFGLGTQTVNITTGNVRTTYNPYTPSPLASTPGPTPNPFNGLACPLGSLFTDVGGVDSCSGTLTQLPQNAAVTYKYVLYKSTTNPALVAAPACVYYTDNTFTTVSGALTDGLTGKAPDFAGLMMVNTGDLSTVTATILNNAGNGSGVWIAVNGFVKQAWIGGLTVATGDYLYGSGSFLPTNVADGAAAPVHIWFATATTVSASNKADVQMRLSYDV